MWNNINFVDNVKSDVENDCVIVLCAILLIFIFISAFLRFHGWKVLNL